MEKLQLLLRQLSVIVSKEQTAAQEKYLRGESFNMFEVCGVNNYEVSHSAIIAELLNPRGTHGQCLIFVEEFIKSINLQDFNFKLDGVTVTTEMVTPNGRIDIVISNNNQQAFIIENKIYACDQWEQLKRYDDFAKTKYTNGYKILYLTLGGSNPSDEASKKVEHTTISYKHHIVDWLSQCKLLAMDKPVIRETLSQYIQHLKKLTNTIEMENNNSTIELLIKHSKETLKILNSQKELEEYIVKKYLFPTLEEVAKELDMQFKCGDTSRFFAKSPLAGFSFIPNTPSTWCIAFEFENGNWSALGVGLVWDEHHRGNRKAKEQLSIFRKKPNDLWFHGWDYVDNGYWDTNYLLTIANNIEEFRTYYKALLENILVNINPQELI